MQFSIIVGNPPYQQDNQSIYQHFINLGIKLNPDYIIMITKSNWMAGKTLEKTRNSMIRFGINHIINYPIPKEIFSDNHVAVAIFSLQDRNQNDTNVGAVENYQTHYKEIRNGKVITDRYIPISTNRPIGINEILSNLINKIQSSKNFKQYNLARNARIFSIASNGTFMLSTETVDILEYNQAKTSEFNVEVVFMDSSHNLYSKYINLDKLPKGQEFVNKYKVICGSKAAKNDIVLSSIYILNPGSIMTNTFSIIGLADSLFEAEAIKKYSCTKFFRSLMIPAISGEKVTFGVGCTIYVPLQNFSETSDIDWTQSIQDIDKQLYQKYNLTTDEINYIESTMRTLDI
jgi:hypothetical protein